MNQEDMIKALEDQLHAEEDKINGLLRAGKIPAKADYADIDRMKNELKAARRVRAMDANRIDPKLTRKVSFLMPEDEYKALLQKANGKDLSKYIRGLIKKGA